MALLLCVACARSPGAEHDPRPSRVVPSEGVNTGPVAVVIEGENFLALATQQLGGGAPVEVDSRFELRLGDTRLEDVVLEDERHLRAVVPPGLATGWHALTVVSPLGRRAELPGAYFSTDRTAPRLEAQALLESPTLAVGQQARLVLEVTNQGGSPARVVTPELAIDGSGQVAVVAEPSPEDVGPGQRVSFAWTLRAEAPGEVRLSLLARGRDAVLERMVEVSAAPITLSTRAPAAFSARVALGAQQVSTGQEFSLALEVGNTGQTLARAVTATADIPGGIRLLAAPEPVDIPGGEARSFVWRLRAEAAGSPVFTVSASGTEVLTGQEVRAGPLTTAPLTVQRAAELSAELGVPAQASVGQEVSISLTVTNTGEATAEAVTPVLELPSKVDVLSQPDPARLVGGERHTFTWRVRPQAPGTAMFTASATGTDANSGAVCATPSLKEPLKVEKMGELVGAVAVAPTQVSVGQLVTVELRVRNDGDAKVRDITASARGAGGGALQPRSSPAVLAQLLGGTEHLFTWTFEATGPGQVLLELSASGFDGNSGMPVTMPPLTSEPVTVQRPSALTATWAPVPERLNVGQVLRVALTVTNTGEALASRVTPSAPTVTGAATRVSGPTPASLELAGGQSGVFSWEYEAGAEGTVSFQASATANDGNSGAALSAPEVGTGPVTVQRPAQLAGTPPPFPSRLNIGQSVELAIQVANTGASTATAVTLVPSGLSGAEHLEGSVDPVPLSADIAGGASQAFVWAVKGASEGAVLATVGASGTDAVDGRALSMAPVNVRIEVQRPAALTASLVGPASVGVGTPFALTLTVSNPGGAEATGVTPDTLSCADTAGLVVRTPPSNEGETVAGGGSTTFSWTLAATRPGTFHCSSLARGRDANDARELASTLATSNTGAAQEVTQLAENPFGDGTAFSFVFRYDGRVYLGPNRTGRGGVRMLPDGSAPEAFTWRLPQDTVGNKTSNSRPPPYLSIGATGCARDTYDCGPDNENGRGHFFAGVMGGREWLGVAGANTAGDLDYIYLTQETDAQLDFRFVDLDEAPLGGQTKGTSAALFFHERLYLGFPDTGGNRPYLVVLKRSPSVAPGLDAKPPDDAVSLEAENMPGLGKSGTPANTAAMQMIDALAAFNDRLYLANNGGCLRSTTPTPRPYGDFPGDWAVCTPSLAAYTQRTSHTTSKTADLEPADKAVPQLAAFGGRLYLARNTFSGPQLFVCAPGRGGDPAQCDPGDWSLVAPNTPGPGRDLLLTQFDNLNNTSLALLVATEQHLYVGFNNATDGVVLLRSEGLTPSAQADFRGTGACLASQHGGGGCAGLGGNGLGVRTARPSRFFDGVALTFGGADFVYATAGDGSAAVRVFRVAD